ncbi:MAG: hypothetical protein ABIP94_05330 [Planctomycetota bacterium]
MRFLRNLDLYKVIVLLSLVLLPLGGWWCIKKRETIEACKDSIYNATKPNGALEQIGALQKKVEVVSQNRRNTSEAINLPRTYFEGRIIQSGLGLKNDDFSISDPKGEPANMGSGSKSKQKADDFVVDVTWKRNDLAPKWDFIYSVLFNCEAGYGVTADASRQSVWKLRELSLENATEGAKAPKPPPPDLEDRWSIKKMSFARREPTKGK